MMSFSGYELSLNVVAAILTIAGYSVNDTIVIFDRVRENMRLMRREPLDKIVNTSVNQTLGRTMHHRGHDVPRGAGAVPVRRRGAQGFAFAMLVGVITGTYSTVFIAAAIAIILSRREFSRRAAAVPAGPRRAASTPPEGAAQARAQRARVLIACPRPAAACAAARRTTPSARNAL